MTATLIKKQHELPMMTAIDFLGPNQKSSTTALSNNNNNNNNKPLPDLIRYLYNHEWKLLLEHLKQHPNEARFLMDEDVISTSTSSNNKDEYYGRTALHYACSIRNVPLNVIEALITAYPMATCYKDTTTGYYTPLHVACTLYKSSPELVRCLLQTNPQGIEAVDKRDSSYRTPLQDLIHSNEFYITRLLQRQKNKKRQRGGQQQQQTPSPAQLQQRKRRAGIEPTITEEEDDEDVAELVEEEETHVHDHVDYLNYQDDPTFQSLWSKATYLVKAAYLGYIDDEDDETSPIKKKKFRMLHACVSLPDCPLKLIELVLLVHPNQALQVDDDGYLPIQIVAKRHLISAIHHLKEEQQQQQQQQQTAILANHAANAQTWTQSSMSSNSPAPPPYLHLTPANSMDNGMKSTIPPMTPMTPITSTNNNTPRGSASGKDLLYLRYSRSNESFSSTTPTSSPEKKKLSSTAAVLPVLPTSPSKRHSGLAGMFSKPKLLSQKSKTISGDGSTEQAAQQNSSSPVSVTTNKHRLVVGTGGSSSNFDHNVQSYHSRDISNISGISMSTTTMGMPALPPHIQRRYWNGTLSNPATNSRISDSHKRQSEQSMAILWLLLSLSTASKQLDHSRTKKLLKKVCESSRSLHTNKSSSSSSSSDNMIGPLDSQHIRRVIQDLLFASPTTNTTMTLDERTGELAMFPWMIVPMRHSSPSKQNTDENDDDDDDVKHIDREMQQIQNHLWNAIHQSKSHDTTGGDESLLALSPKSSWESGGGYTSHTNRHQQQQQHQRPPAVPRTNHHHHQQQSTTSHARSSPQGPAETTPQTTSRSKSPVRAPSPSPLTNNNRTNHHHHHSSGVTIPEDTAVDVVDTYHKSTTNDHQHHHHRHNSGSSSKRAEQRQDDESAASMSRQRRNHRKNQVAASSTTTTTGITNHKRSPTKSPTTTIKSIGSSSSMGASSNGSSSKLSTTTIRNHNNNRMKKPSAALPPTVPKSSGTKVPLKHSTSTTTKSVSSSKKSGSSSKKTATSSSSGRKHHHAF